MSGSRYLRLCLFYTLGILATIVPVNYLVDPYGIYLYGTKWDWPHTRPALTDSPWMHKAHLLERVNADILLMGSSRVAWGLDPYSPALPAKTYNAGLGGGRVYECWRYLMHASAFHMPAIVVLGVESSIFVPKEAHPSFSEERMSVGPDGQVKPAYAYVFADTIPTLLSLSTFKLSLQSLLAPHTDKYDFNGGFSQKDAYFWYGWASARAPLAINASVGKTWLDEADSFRGADGSTPEMDAFGRIVSFCAQHHIRLIVFVHPMHAATLDKITSNWADYCDWMRTLMATADRTPGGQVEVWDFAGYDAISTEPFPRPTDPDNHLMRFWLDRWHYRQPVGDMVLQRLFGAGGPPSFGHPVTVATVEQDLSRLKAEKEAWHSRGQMVEIPEAAAVAGASK